MKGIIVSSRYSLYQVISDDVIYNVDRDLEEKIGKLYVLQGNKPIEVSELHAGDIGALAKLTAARTGNSLSTKANPIQFAKAEISKGIRREIYSFMMDTEYADII